MAFLRTFSLFLYVLISSLGLGATESKPVDVSQIIRVLNTEDRRVREGITMHEGCPVSFEDLRVVRVPYYASQENLEHPESRNLAWGEIVVHKAIAEKVRDIFLEIVEVTSKSIPIQSIVPIFRFGGDDEKSMRANNTSAFNCRKALGSTRFSKHAYGLAIDLNPFWNPYVKGTTIAPKGSKSHARRRRSDPRHLHSTHPIVKIFKKYGFKWGGDWRSLKDYQHFEISL